MEGRQTPEEIMSRLYQRRDGQDRLWWWIDFNDARGIRHRKKVSPSKRVAQEALDAMNNTTAREEFVGVVEESAISFGDYAKVWRDRILPRTRATTAGRWEGIVRLHLAPAFRGSLRAITRAEVESYRARRLEDRATPACVNRETSVIRHMMARAVEWGYLRTNPFAGFKSLREPSGRTRFLAEDEIPALLDACEQSRANWLKAFALVALNTGLRRSDILSLTRKSIDWQNRIATVAITKHGDAEHVRLNDVAMEALRSLPARLDGYLFPVRDGHTVSRAFRRAVVKAGIADFRLHDTKHTFLSYHAMSGAQPRTLQSLAHHKDPRMTARYAHLSDEYLRDAVDRVQIGTSQPEQSRKEVREL
jgi:integrase